MDNNNQKKLDVEKEILIEYLKVLRDEMHLRLNKNYQLVLAKLLGIATVTSFFIVNVDKIEQFSNLVHWFYILIPVLSMMFDFQIAYNLKWMNTTASFNRDRVESFFAKHYDIPLYEIKALGFPAYLNRLVDIGVTAILLTFGLIGIGGGPFSTYLKIIISVAMLFVFLISAVALLNSTKGYKFKNTEENSS